MADFEVGDAVALVKPFRHDSDTESVDELIDAEIRRVFGDATPTATITVVGETYYKVDFDRRRDFEDYAYSLFLRKDCVGALVSDDDYEATLRSIAQAQAHRRLT